MIVRPQLIACLREAAELHLFMVIEAITLTQLHNRLYKAPIAMVPSYPPERAFENEMFE